MWSERGREARLPVSARRIHDAARERRTPWSVTPDCGRPAALTRGAAKGTTCSCILSALYLLDGPNLGSRAKTLQPAQTSWCLPTRRSRVGGKRQAKLVHCFAPHCRPCRWASGWFAPTAGAVVETPVGHVGRARGPRLGRSDFLCLSLTFQNGGISASAVVETPVGLVGRARGPPPPGPGDRGC